MVSQNMLNSLFRHDPDHGNEYVKEARYPWTYICGQYPDQVEERRYFRLPVFAHRLNECGIAGMLANDRELEQPVRSSGKQKNDAVQRRRSGCKMAFSHPGGRERNKGKSEEQYQIEPHQPPVHCSNHVQ